MQAVSDGHEPSCVGQEFTVRVSEGSFLTW